MTDRSEIDDAIATLAQQLRGAVDIVALGGIEHLPRPRFLLLPSPARREAVGAGIASSPQARAGGKPVANQHGPMPAPQASLRIVPAGDDVAAAIARVVASSAPSAERLEALRLEVIGECTRCKLHRGRRKIVFGVGKATAELVFVGEGPGADEDRQGIPFVGLAGQLLTKMIEAMGKQRGDVYICNVVKCRPPNNRDPEPDEVQACESFLKAQLAIVKPRVIVALGRHAAQTLLRTKTPITKLRGTWQSYEGIDVMPTYHPSYLLREEARKREAWSDLQQVMKLLATPSAPEPG